jgi:hypothetical protein
MTAFESRPDSMGKFCQGENHGSMEPVIRTNDTAPSRRGRVRGRVAQKLVRKRCTGSAEEAHLSLFSDAGAEGVIAPRSQTYVKSDS